LQAFFQSPLLCGEVADALLERGVVGGEPLGGVAVVLTMGVAELAEQAADAGALDADLGVRGFERLLGVQRPLLPGRLRLGIAVRCPRFSGQGIGRAGRAGAGPARRSGA
jgi:hypothetical protein